eukprot:Awhi_evm2s13459
MSGFPAVAQIYIGAAGTCTGTPAVDVTVPALGQCVGTTLSLFGSSVPGSIKIDSYDAATSTYKGNAFALSSDCSGDTTIPLTNADAVCQDIDVSGIATLNAVLGGQKVNGIITGPGDTADSPAPADPVVEPTPVDEPVDPVVEEPDTTEIDETTEMDMETTEVDETTDFMEDETAPAPEVTITKPNEKAPANDHDDHDHDHDHGGRRSALDEIENYLFDDIVNHASHLKAGLIGALALTVSYIL